MNLVEVSAYSVPWAIDAQNSGAQRVELCDNMYEGGTTPSIASMILARKNLHIDLYVIIRPRGGDFLYTDLEFEIMKERKNMEHVAYVNRENEIQYFSLGSSSLYVILALVPESTSVSLIENDALQQKLSTQVQINKLYNSIGIKIV